MNTKIIIESSFDGQVQTITLANGKGNVMDKDMMMELDNAVKEIGKNSVVKAIVFRGDGAHFSFGASVPEHQKDLAPEMLKTFHGLFKSLCEVCIPTFAVVRGQCLGGGMELAIFCNWIFAGEDARFGQPEIGLSVFAPVASLILPNLIGQAAADDLLLTGRAITAARAKELGLIQHVSIDPEKEIHIFLEQHILLKSAIALRKACRAARHHFYHSFLRDLDELECAYTDDLMATHDANEGIQAFLDKRKPVWTNS